MSPSQGKTVECPGSPKTPSIPSYQNHGFGWGWSSPTAAMHEVEEVTDLHGDFWFFLAFLAGSEQAFSPALLLFLFTSSFMSVTTLAFPDLDSVSLAPAGTSVLAFASTVYIVVFASSESLINIICTSWSVGVNISSRF